MYNLITFNYYVWIELGGYNAARADFDTEYDNGIELTLTKIEVDEKMYQIVKSDSYSKQCYKDYSDENEENEQLNSQLSVVMLDVYKNKLKARSKRKR
jgi:hypothetical protein